MKRFSENFLNKWIAKGRKKPLVVRGARQVGKSTLVRQFAKAKGLSLCEINLERHPTLDSLFKTLDPSRIIQELSLLVKKKILLPNSLLFLDEIQATPHALQALRYFYEDFPDLSVIAAGSLLEFSLSKHQLSMPVGRIEYLHLGPMSFEEYLHACEEFELIERLNHFSFKTTFPQTAHSQLLQRYREYLFVGGMPEVVQTYLINQDWQEVSDKHIALLDTFKDDFSKYAKQKDLLRLHHVFQFIPKAVGHKVKYSTISKEETSKTIREVISLLIKARLFFPVYHSSCSGIPLSAIEDLNIYKLLFLDVGLMNASCGLDWLALSKMDPIELINKGATAEQYIGQHLAYRSKGRQSPHLNYWLRGRKTANAECDYVLSHGDWVIPVEVKAGKTGRLKSLHQFAIEKGNRLAIRFDLNPPSIQSIKQDLRQADHVQTATYSLLSLPTYMVGQVDRLITRIRTES